MAGRNVPQERQLAFADPNVAIGAKLGAEAAKCKGAKASPNKFSLTVIELASAFAAQNSVVVTHMYSPLLFFKPVDRPKRFFD